jgi:hypothetical protein
MSPITHAPQVNALIFAHLETHSGVCQAALWQDSGASVAASEV